MQGHAARADPVFAGSCRQAPAERPGSDQGSDPTTALGAVGKESMTYRELSMIDVKELLRRWSARQSNRQIAADAGADRGTVGRYVDVAKELGFEPGHEFTEEQVHEIAQRVQARPVVSVLPPP